MESAFKSDFTRVRVHESLEAERFGALAFTRGESVHVAPGAFQLESSRGRRVMAHELAHVEQQRHGIVRPTTERGGYPANDEPRLEQAAERAAGRAVLGAGVPAPPTAGARRASGNVVQCMDSDDEDELSSRKRKHQYKKGINKEEARHKRVNLRIEQGQEARERQLEERRKIAERDALLRKPPVALEIHWYSIRERALKAINVIEEYHGRLKGDDARQANAFYKLDTKTGTIISTIQRIDQRFGRGPHPDRDKAKAALVESIIAGNKILKQLGRVSSQALTSLSPLEDFAGDLDNRRYHTGTPTDPIPIIWYKARRDYEAIVIPPRNGAGVTPGSYQFPNGPEISHGFPFDLKVAKKNQPKEKAPGQFVLRKREPGTRPATPKKDRANFALKAAGYGLRDNGRELDGDHVRDLGFSGDDEYDNYWPLDTRVNQRAYFGYNRDYIINFIDNRKDKNRDNPNGNPKGRPTSQPIGGLVGKFFSIKAFMAKADPNNVPSEGDRDDPEVYSGTEDLA